MWIAGAFFLALIVAIPGYASYVEYYRPPRQLVVRVNDTSYNMGYYVKMLRLFQMLSTAQGEQFDLSVIPFELVQLLEENELIRQGTPRLNISVTPDDVSQEIRSRILGAPTPEEEQDQAKLEKEFQQSYRQLLGTLKFSDKEYRRIVEIDLLREKLREQLGLQVPTVAEQVHLQGIFFSSQTEKDPEEQAKEIADRVAAGEEFSALSGELSEDDTLKANDGDMGWLPKGIMGAKFDEVAFGLEPGKVSELIVTYEGYYVIKVLEKAAARDIDADAREKLKDQALAEWLSEERGKNEVVRSFDSKKYEWAVQQLPPSSSQSSQGDQIPAA
jgi:parvulin-like peptidyl-prolyl isomerase